MQEIITSEHTVLDLREERIKRMTAEISKMCLEECDNPLEALAHCAHLLAQVNEYHGETRQHLKFAHWLRQS